MAVVVSVLVPLFILCVCVSGYVCEKSLSLRNCCDSSYTISVIGVYVLCMSVGESGRIKVSKVSGRDCSAP